jgi:Gas vesicle synthesis protein GvpL/GvpF
MTRRSRPSYRWRQPTTAGCSCAGKVELNVKGTHRQDAVPRALLLDNETLRARNDALRARGGGSYADRMRFAEELAAALADRRGRDARQVLAWLEPYACETCFGADAGGFVNASWPISPAGSTKDSSVRRSAKRSRSRSLTAWSCSRRSNPGPCMS